MPGEVAQWIAQLDHADDFNQTDIALIQHTHDFVLRHATTAKPGMLIAEALSSIKADSNLISAGIAYPVFLHPNVDRERCLFQLDKTVAKIIRGALQMDIIHSIQPDQIDKNKNEKKKETASQSQADNLRKMMLAMADDIRTVLLKLAERLILLQHAGGLPQREQQKMAQDTMDFYAPLANRLGIGHFKWQLEDWSFRYLHPQEFDDIVSALHMRETDRVRFIHAMIAELKTLVDRAGIKNAKISGRIKHIYSIYKKMMRKNMPVEHIYDTNALRILVPSVADCYAILSDVHEKWTPITSEFDDYIAKPKPNGYQSIHTAVLMSDGTAVEIQIRTHAMHEKAEMGFAAHWKYKENKSIHTSDEEKIILMRELLETQTHLFPHAFYDRIYVFSPNGNVFDLPQGATPLDFAYLVHTDLGHRCKGSKVNDVLVPLTHLLQTGDRIEILTTKEAHPSLDWLRSDLGYLKTTHAKQKVRQWFRKQNDEKHLAAGIAIWEKLCLEHELDREMIHDLPELFNFKNDQSLFIALGSGNINPQILIRKIKIKHKLLPLNLHIDKPKKENDHSGALSVQGVTHLLTQLARCCHPIPGDHIIGFITKGRGITVHQKSCRNMIEAKNKHPERLIDITWDQQRNQARKNYHVNLEMQCEDRAGLLHDISGVISQLNLSISALSSRVNSMSGTSVIHITIDVHDLSSLETIMKKIRQVTGVVRVVRKQV